MMAVENQIREIATDLVVARIDTEAFSACAPHLIQLIFFNDKYDEFAPNSITWKSNSPFGLTGEIFSR